MIVGGPCSIGGCKRSTMYGSNKCYKHKDLVTDDYPGIEQIKIESVNQDKMNSHVLFNVDGNDFSMPSKNIDELIRKISKAKQFWTVELGLYTDEFIQYAIDKEELEHWKDGKMLESVEMGHERALSTLKEKITDPNLTTGLWWKVDGDETKSEDTGSIAIQIAIFFVILFVMSFMYNLRIYEFLGNITGELCCYGLMAIGGMGASISRTKEGRFE